ncbi:hypothetical protein CcI156_19340 [Frankia sp. CcI156]|jgi:hypothetical protein|uniref:MABP domain-containing protein n=1 Tax=Frankia casuarinae (strain DSM 45818 / CECT 9043 / HFP020203 / CcI3) TaxID=106370 RepID=Q2J9F6_FRACC|nr:MULTISPECIES: hypothetical protein [Frankia]ABD12086.1 hypothetical protein Francci3_2726 [Frankia casuarinae]ETA00598.1 hypothetical protein CcI6DRAFT_03988 [Frankia sp. CcI6]EYT91872.1 hypothetical protein ThrDRAFT_02517 [Frankia casuarinae]KDA41308.1 hypothetical protein BMG523Draft_03851 [Frankia sp. BMG5.23]KFB03108.1 hypothetical protein ALLO2DRAFT_04147 [Frankia sp. Allo2]
MSNVTNLTVLIDSEPAPSGWIKIDKDLNAGAGGAYLYFAYEKGAGDPITNIIFLLNKDESAPPSYHRIDVDLNKGAGGAYIYAAFTREPALGSPIEDLDVILGDNSGIQPQAPWRRIDVDLNKGAGGKYIYLVYRTA